MPHAKDYVCGFLRIIPSSIGKGSNLTIRQLNRGKPPSDPPNHIARRYGQQRNVSAEDYVAVSHWLLSCSNAFAEDGYEWSLLV